MWNHSLREANQVAAALAKFGLSHHAQDVIFYHVPSFLAFIVWADVAMTYFPRGF